MNKRKPPVRYTHETDEQYLERISCTYTKEERKIMNMEARKEAEARGHGDLWVNNPQGPFRIVNGDLRWVEDPFWTRKNCIALIVRIQAPFAPGNPIAADEEFYAVPVFMNHKDGQIDSNAFEWEDGREPPAGKFFLVPELRMVLPKHWVDQSTWRIACVDPAADEATATLILDIIKGIDEMPDHIEEPKN